MHRRKILIVEDELLLADDCASWVRQSGLEVAGPFDNIDAVRFDPYEIAGAIIGLNVGRRKLYQLLDQLLSLDVPVTLYTGYDRRLIPPKYARCGYVQKPCSCEKAIEALCNELKSR
jgi:DNA-binding NtrC family response regulator